MTASLFSKSAKKEMPWIHSMIVLFSSFFLLFLSSSPAYGLEQSSATVSTSGGSRTIQYIQFHPTEDLELRPVLAQNKVGQTESLASMAQRTGAVAAINGTFFNAYDARDLQPMGALMIDGVLQHFRGGPTAVGMPTDQRLLFGPTDSIKILGGINGSRNWPNNWYAWFMNHEPTSHGEIVLFTPSFRSKTLSFTGFTFVVVDGGTVTSIRKDSATIPDQGFVIAYGPAPQNQEQINKFKVGDQVESYIEFPSSLESLRHLMSAGPKLVSRGAVDVNFEREGIRDPKLTTYGGLRSFIGTRSDGTIVIGTMPNVTIRQLAEGLVNLGLQEAMNLDGGASSGLYYQGRYVTTPGRNLSNSLVVVPRKRVPIVEVNGREIVVPGGAPFIEDGTTMVPVRGIFEALGATLHWDGPTNSVIAKRYDREIRLPVGQRTAFMNGVAQDVPKAPVNRNGRVYIPLRFVSEALDAHVHWDPQRYGAIITSTVKSGQIHYEKAMQLLQQGQEDLALIELEQATMIDPTLSDAWMALGDLYNKKRDYRKAMEAFGQVSDNRAFIPLGWAAYSSGAFDEAIAAFTKAVAVPEHRVAGHYGLGVTYRHFQVQAYDQSAVHLRQVIELAPQSTQAQEARRMLAQ
ncbi:stalk domain-containing protein [Heliorestis convoluta]|uniref:Copper amine oxidase domain protein, putative n=1 Tax=Heliorestis convoluta TaxID=356322 RepID=A0A5Q2MYV2_9FIRM|nr:stalk domain-containing protein [Heliorestis convoluta]QGG46579.1 copper amine oxidase domain protein, putative [Heliorestis convoluta]